MDDTLEICVESNEFDAEEEELIQLIPSSSVAESSHVSSGSRTPSAVRSVNSDSRNCSDDESDGDHRPSRKRRKAIIAKEKTESSSVRDNDGRNSLNSAVEISAAAHPSGEQPASNHQSKRSHNFKRPSDRKPIPTGNGPMTIHINKHFRGTVQSAPGTCLAWDPLATGGNFRGASMLNGSVLPGVKPFGSLAEGSCSPVLAGLPFVRPVIPLPGVVAPVLPLPPLHFRPELVGMRPKMPLVSFGRMLPVPGSMGPPIPPLPLNMRNMARLRNNAEINQQYLARNFDPHTFQMKRNRKN
ncbi:uncharacterized protein LOC129586405 [Paramacrobiotus metropolitanus]|uniref:uncharacterized protein LOC129586405 n=1 Tax=Paramacrobiotus metropolitanus TaxID=2943436 RepID=UPI002445EFAF|nr:uncharacterized protein LOC129586405 [Paramacrobiotus metropolitanus]